MAARSPKPPGGDIGARGEYGYTNIFVRPGGIYISISTFSR